MLNKKRSGLFAESAIMLLVVAIFLIFIAKIFSKTTAPAQPQEEDQEIAKMVKDYKNSADLVIVGKLLNTKYITNTDNNDDHYNYFLEVEVENVERGSYAGKIILFRLGAKNFTLLESLNFQYPSFIKIRYLKGDRLRAYLMWNGRQGMYVCDGAYFTVEPVTEISDILGGIQRYDHSTDKSDGKN